MAKKRTATATPLKNKPIYKYIVGFNTPQGLNQLEVLAMEYLNRDGEIDFYGIGDDKGLCVASFCPNAWVFVKNMGPIGSEKPVEQVCEAVCES